jgi:GTP-binding protein
VIADLTEVGQRVCLAKGGNGGWGNLRFKTSTNRAPARANPRARGDRAHDLAAAEADRRCGACWACRTRASRPSLPPCRTRGRRSRIIRSRRWYPNLGVVGIDGHEFVMADIPGLIEGASEGRGLGDQFLGPRRTLLGLLHLVDGTSSTITKDYRTIVTELEAYSPDLATSRGLRR